MVSAPQQSSEADLRAKRLAGMSDVRTFFSCTAITSN